MCSGPRCACALEDKGFAARDICIVPPLTALRQLQAAQWQEEHERVLALDTDTDRSGETIKEEQQVRDDLESVAQAGHTFIGAHLPQDGQIGRVSDIHFDYPVYHLYGFELGGITRLR